MANLENNTIWPDVEERIVDLIEAHHSSIVFTNSRRLAERHTRLNEIRRTARIELPSAQPPSGRRVTRASWAAGWRRAPHRCWRPPRLGRQGSAPRSRRPEDRAAEAVVATSSLGWASTWARSTGDLVESPPSVAMDTTHRYAGISRRSRRASCAEAPHRPDRLRGDGRRMLSARSNHAGADEPARRAGPAQWPPARPSRWMPISAPTRGEPRRRDTRAARVERRWTRSAGSTRLPSSPNCALGLCTTRRGHAHRPARGTATGGHVRWRDPRPRPVHCLPGFQR